MLQQILYKVNIQSVAGDTSVSVKDLQTDSRNVTPGTCFIALKGLTVDGHDFMEQAACQGASAIICERLPNGLAQGVTYVLVGDTAHAAGVMSHNFHGSPSEKMKLVGVTGTNGKTTIATLLWKLFTDLGHTCGLISNIGTSLVDVVMHEAADVLAVEVGAPQLPFVTSMNPLAAACLNLADDHLDHFGSFDAYAGAKARVYQGAQVAAVFNAADAATIRMVEQADVRAGCRAIGFTLGIPDVSMLGVVDGALVDRAFIADRRTTAQELALVGDVRPAAPHNVANALAAAALARAYGVAPGAVREGLRSFTPAGHRIALVAEIDHVAYVDDSKATNAHAALTSLTAYPSVVWIAGGLAKGQSFDELVTQAAGRIRAAVLLGADRNRIADALRSRAPHIPIVEVDAADAAGMDDAVRHAMAVAQPGDTVLLAPGCASWDMFRDYAHRGDAFADAVLSRCAEVPSG